MDCKGLQPIRLNLTDEVQNDAQIHHRQFVGRSFPGRFLVRLTFLRVFLIRAHASNLLTI